MSIRIGDHAISEAGAIGAAAGLLGYASAQRVPVDQDTATDLQISLEKLNKLVNLYKSLVKKDSSELKQYIEEMKQLDET